jgi:hypothetical protein
VVGTHPVHVEINHGAERQVESVTARCGDGNGAVFIRIEGGDAGKASFPPLPHVSDELAASTSGRWK